MGAQAAALLDAGGPVGEVPPPVPVVGGLRLRAPGPFPEPADVAALGEDALRARGWGYRAPSLLALARAVAEGRRDPQRWRDPAVEDDEVLAGLRGLDGFGPFAAATALPLMGPRPRPLVLDGWLRRQVPDPSSYEVMGRWAGTGLWLAVTAARWRRG